MRTRKAVESGISRYRLFAASTDHPFHGVVRNPLATSSADGLQHLRPDDEFIRRAAEFQTLLYPKSVISHTSAGRILQLPNCSQESALHITVADGLRPRRPGVVGHRTSQLEHVDFRRLRISPPLRLVTELSSMLSGLQLHVTLESMLGPWRFGPLLSLADVQAVASLPTRFRGKAALRALLPQLREKVASPRETQLRMVIVNAGLPEPAIAPPVRLDGFTVHPDLAYLNERISIEYEGRQHAENPEQFRLDIERYNSMQAHGWTVVRVDHALLQNPQRLIAIIRTHLSDARR